MAVRMLDYTVLLHRRLITNGVFGERAALPPVLPVVIYNGRRRWSVAVEMTDQMAAGAGCWCRTSRRSDIVFWTGRACRTRTCQQTTWCQRSSAWSARDAAHLREALEVLVDVLGTQDDEHLTQVFVEVVVDLLRAALRENDPASPRRRAVVVRG